MDFSRRTYREGLCPPGFHCFQVKIKETDLAVAVDGGGSLSHIRHFTESRILFYRAQLEAYISQDPDFRTTLEPHPVLPEAPPIALAMARAGNFAGVGPMAAVAGALAELVGRDLLRKNNQVIVENGGDIFLKTDAGGKVAVFAGPSPLSNRIAIELTPRTKPYGICTSSGTVGPSLSLGRADAAVIIAESAILADAVATATANRVQTSADLHAALQFARSVPGVEGVLIIKDDKLTAWGNLRLTSAG